MIGLLLALALAAACPGQSRGEVLHELDELYTANLGSNFAMKAYEGKDAKAIAEFVAKDAGNPSIAKATEVDVYIGQEDDQFYILMSFQDGQCTIHTYGISQDTLKEIITKALGQDL